MSIDLRYRSPPSLPSYDESCICGNVRRVSTAERLASGWFASGGGSLILVVMNGKGNILPLSEFQLEGLELDF